MRSRTVLALSLFALLLAAYLLAYSGDVQSSDELSMFCVTRNLATRGATDTDAIRWMGLQQGAYGLGGHLYSKYGLGSSLVAVPLYALMRFLPLDLGAVQVTWFLNAILTALTGALVFLSVAHLGCGDGVHGTLCVALATGLLYGLTTLAVVYSQSFFSEPLAALGLLAAGYFLLRFRSSQRSPDAALAGAALGLALLARISNAVVVPIFGLYLLASCWPGRSLARTRDRSIDLRRWMARAWCPVLAFTVPLVLGTLVVAAYNALRYGDPLQTGYHPLETFSTPFFTGLVGLLFSPGKSLFLYAPILLLSVVAFPAFFRRHRAEALLIGGVFTAHVLLYAPWFVWHGGHCWGPRFLVPTLPFLALALAPALVWATRSPWRIALIGTLALISGAVQVLGLAVSFDQFFDTMMDDLGLPLYDPRLFFDPAYSPLLWQVRFVLVGDPSAGSGQGLFPAWARGDWALLVFPLILFALAFGGLVLASTGHCVWRVSRRRTMWLASLVLVGACVATPLALVVRLYPDPRPPRPAYRDLTGMLDDLARPGDAVVLNAPARTAVLLEYLRAPISVLGLHEPGKPSPENEAALLQYAMAYRRIWLVSDETVPADGLDNWLTAHGYKTLTAEYGSAGLALYAFPPEPPPAQALDITLGEQITLMHGGTAAHVASGDVLPVAVTWQPAGPWPDPDGLHLLVQLFATDRTLLVQQDWALVPAGETTTRMGLLIPAHTAPGTYRLEARVYRVADGRRLTTPAGEETVPLGEVAISGP